MLEKKHDEIAAIVVKKNILSIICIDTTLF